MVCRSRLFRCARATASRHASGSIGFAGVQPFDLLEVVDVVPARGRIHGKPRTSRPVAFKRPGGQLVTAGRGRLGRHELASLRAVRSCQGRA